jgi:hypothetical protein
MHYFHQLLKNEMVTNPNILCYSPFKSNSPEIYVTIPLKGTPRNICYSPFKRNSPEIYVIFRLLTDFFCLYTYEFWLSLCKIVRSSVILLLPLFKRNSPEIYVTIPLKETPRNICYSPFKRKSPEISITLPLKGTPQKYMLLSL